MSDASASARAVLAALAGLDPIERADEAIDDIDDAVAFVETIGLERLAGAVAHAEGERRERGAAALAAFLRFRAAADGRAVERHFRRGRGTHLSRGAERSDR